MKIELFTFLDKGINKKLTTWITLEDLTEERTYFNNNYEIITLDSRKAIDAYVRHEDRRFKYLMVRYPSRIDPTANNDVIRKIPIHIWEEYTNGYSLEDCW